MNYTIQIKEFVFVYSEIYMFIQTCAHSPTYITIYMYVYITTINEKGSHGFKTE